MLQYILKQDRMWSAHKPSVSLHNTWEKEKTSYSPVWKWVHYLPANMTLASESLIQYEWGNCFNLQRFSVINISARLCSITRTFKVQSRNYGRMEFLPKHNSNAIKAYILKHAGCFEDVKPADGLPNGPPEHRQGPEQPLCSADMPIKSGLRAATELVPHATICQTGQIICGPIWEKHPAWQH